MSTLLSAASPSVGNSDRCGGEYLSGDRVQPGMTDWRAVGYGFVVMLIAGLLASFAPVVGHVGAGLIGGFVAGYVAGGGLLSGAWHGLLAGSVSGVVVTLLLAAFGGLVGLAGGPVGSLLGGAGVLVVGLFLTFLFAVDSALAGAVGGVLGD